MRCPSCRRDSFIKKADFTNHFLVDYLCLNCGQTWHPLRIPPKQFLEQEIAQKANVQEALDRLAEMRARPVSLS